VYRERVAVESGTFCYRRIHIALCTEYEVESGKTQKRIVRAGEKTPVPPGLGEGAHVCSGASCYVWEKFSGRVQMYDGCCSVR